MSVCFKEWLFKRNIERSTIECNEVKKIVDGEQEMERDSASSKEILISKRFKSATESGTRQKQGSPTSTGLNSDITRKSGENVHTILKVMRVSLFGI